MTNPVVPTYINPLPPAPEVTDSVPEFDSKAFPFVEALVDLTGEINATAAGTYQNALAAGEGAVTSTTSAGVATIAKNDAVIAKNYAQAAQAAAEAARDDALTNTKGWSPMLRLENDGDRRVLFVYDWTGGAGTKPSVTGYIGASGLTPNKSLAIDVRGKQGLPGTGGDLMQILGGFDASNQTPITDTDTLLGGIGKAQGQINKTNATLASAVLSYPDYATAAAAAGTLPDGQGVKTEGVEYRVAGGDLVPVKVVERFFTRQAFVAFQRKDLIPNGAVVEAGGERYLAETGSAVIQDLPGFVPFGYVSPSHWGVVSTDSFEKSLQYAADSGLEWWASGEYSLNRNIEIILRSDKAHTLNISPAGRLVVTGTQTSPATSGWTESTGAWTPGDISYNSDQLIKVTNEIAVSGVTSATAALGSVVVQLDANLINVGDLAVLTTSVPIPVESRGGKNTFGQVVKVIGKTPSSITIAEQLECDIPSGSRFEAYRPSTLIIGEGLRLKRAPTTNAAAGDLGFRGLTVSHLDTPLVNNSDIDGFSECGLRFVECYKPRAEKNSVSRANRAYDTSDGTGYGMSVIGCYGYKGRDNSFTGCRRGSDLGTFGITSWFCEEDSPVTTSGGVTYTGAQFYPEGEQHTSAVGGHGPSYYSDFVNAKAINCRYHHMLRGLKERVIGGSHVGYGSSLGLIYGSGGSTIDGVQYLDGGRDGVYPAGYDHGRRMKWATGVYLPAVENTLPITIKNVTAESLVQGFIFLDAGGGSGEAPVIRTENNVVTAVKTSSASHFQGVFTSGNVSLKSGSDFSGINYRIAGAKYGADWLIQPSSSLYLNSGDYIKIGNNQWIINISNDTAVPFPIYSNSDLCIVDVWDNAATPKYIGLSLAIGLGRGQDLSPLTATNRQNVSVLPSPLTGTTGLVGHVTMSTAGTGATAGRMLNIENRTGSATYARLRISQG